MTHFVKEVAKDVIHETLESGGSVGKSEGHNQPFKRTIAGTESGFPFFASERDDRHDEGRF